LQVLDFFKEFFVFLDAQHHGDLLAAFV